MDEYKQCCETQFEIKKEYNCYQKNKDYLINILHGKADKQQGNLEFASLNKDGVRWSKWKSYFEIKENPIFIKQANNRTILPNEIVIDIDVTPNETEKIKKDIEKNKSIQDKQEEIEKRQKQIIEEKFKRVLTKIKKEVQFYTAYNTGSKGYHIHLFFKKELSQEEKLLIIKRYEGDTALASKHLIALENCEHWKTGNPKTLIEGTFGINSDAVLEELKKPFNFECKPTNVKAVLNVVEKNFQMMAFYVECCLSCIMCLLIEDLAAPIGLNLEGAPSSEKTTILEFFVGLIELVFKSDIFTSKSFVSHSANVSKNELEHIDLLPKIKNKVFLVLELAPLLGKRKDDLIENLSVLTRLFDGQGLESDSGVMGHRGYTGDYLFIWLGATTPLGTHVWNVMGKLGGRFLFLKLPNKNKSNEDLKKVMTEMSYKKKVSECRYEIQNLIKFRFNQSNGLYSTKWNKEKDDPELLNWIVSLSKFLGSLRAPIEIYTNGYNNEEHQFKAPVKEEPERAISQLYDIARGHAILYERNYITMDDARLFLKLPYHLVPMIDISSWSYSLITLLSMQKYFLN